MTLNYWCERCARPKLNAFPPTIWTIAKGR